VSVTAGKPDSATEVVTVGVLSDTHGRLYPRVRQVLEGVDHIIHAGDVGSPRVLAELAIIAPVTAVRGNCDHEAWAQTLPSRAEVELGGARILVGHIAGKLRETADTTGLTGQTGRDRGLAVVITGHSHIARIEKRDGVLYLNPGSAGPRRLGQPRTVARLEIHTSRADEVGARSDVSAEILAAEATIPVYRLLAT
jgi:putative phosphoesterase